MGSSSKLRTVEVFFVMGARGQIKLKFRAKTAAPTADSSSSENEDAVSDAIQIFGRSTFYSSESCEIKRGCDIIMQ